MTSTHPQLAAIADRIGGLYSLPAVAMEVLRLTDQPDVDAEALTRCIEKDPALTVKVLRVVNSSLFGLSHKVGSLNQALAMLGTSPLKLLVLGFSLPDKLFLNTRKDQLTWYWTTSLTRAVAARQLSQSMWNQGGDEAFLAGLLQDIGLLALLRELDDRFAHFLGQVIAQRGDLARAEQEALGFDHRELTAVMLSRWNLPDELVQAIATRDPPMRLARRETPDAQIAKLLRLGDLLAQLVWQRRISVLPDLLDAGALYCELNKPKLFEIVGKLQPQVDQLAEVLALELPGGRNYEQVLLEAHEQLSQVAAAAAGPLARLGTVEQTGEELLIEAQALGLAVEEFLSPSGPPTRHTPAEVDQTQWNLTHAPHARLAGEVENNLAKSVPVAPVELLTNCVMSAARGCRMRRAELSLLIIEIDAFDLLPSDARNCVSRLLAQACCAEMPADAEMLRVASGQRAIVLPGLERRQAVALTNHIVSRLQGALEDVDRDGTLTPVTLSAGVATATSIYKNFVAVSLVEGAQRSLSAARASGGTAVKSIEVY